MPSLFNTPAPQGVVFREKARQARYAKRDLSDFAEALAHGATIAEAGRVIGISRQQASKHFRRICLELGDQAK